MFRRALIESLVRQITTPTEPRRAARARGSLATTDTRACLTMAAAAGLEASPTKFMSPTRSGMTELMPFPHQTAVKPHISQQWLERSRSKLERQGHGPALDNLWSSDTLALYPIISDEACERMSADRRVLHQIKNNRTSSRGTVPSTRQAPHASGCFTGACLRPRRPLLGNSETPAIGPRTPIQNQTRWMEAVPGG